MESPTTLRLFDDLDSDAIQLALRSHRPLLTHLNADTTWLLQLPYPPDQLQTPGRCRYTIIIDPWFQGSQVDVAAWFSTQWHLIESSVQTVEELNERLKKVDNVDLRQEYDPENVAGRRGNRLIDAIIVSHEFSDHCNKNTLLEFGSETPVFATERAATLIESWKYFESVHVIPPLTARDPDWRKSSIGTLPHWLGISKIFAKSDAVDLHSALLIAFDLGVSPDSDCPGHDMEKGEGIIYTPHGIHGQDLGPLRSVKPPIRTLALLHGLDEVFLSPFWQLNLGAHNGLEAQRICQARYWISTHDEVKRGTGLVAPFLKRKALTLQDAMKAEKGEIKSKDTCAKVVFADLCSGESIALM